MTIPPPHLDPDGPTEDGEHPLYAFLLREAGQDPSDLAIVQTAYFHRPVQDFLGIWVCERCGWCQAVPSLDPGVTEDVHHPVHAYAPCEQLRLLAWPYRRRPGFLERWLPEEVIPTNPPTRVGGRNDT